MSTPLKFVDRALTVQEQIWAMAYSQRSDLVALTLLIVARAHPDTPVTQEKVLAMPVPFILLTVVPALYDGIKAAWDEARLQTDAIRIAKEEGLG